MELDFHYWLHFHVVNFFPCNYLYFLTSHSSHQTTANKPLFTASAKLSEGHWVAIMRKCFSPPLLHFSEAFADFIMLSSGLSHRCCAKSVLPIPIHPPYCNLLPTPQLHNIRTSLSSRFPVFTNWYQLCISNLKHILNYRCSLFKLTLNLNNFISSFKFIFSSTSAGTTTLGRPSSPLSLTSLLNDRTTVSFSLYSVLHSTISVTFIPHISDHFPLLLKVFPWHLFVFQFISELFCIFHSNFKTCLVILLVLKSLYCSWCSFCEFVF